MSQQSSPALLIQYIGYPIYINTSLYYISYDRYESDGGDLMGYGCCGVRVDQVRNFLTREERITLLKEYKDGLEKEVQGIGERIRELEEK
jgi:Fic family protein